MKFNVVINNAPEKVRKYVIANLVEGQLWYYANWDDRSKAEKMASELKCAIILEREDD